MKKAILALSALLIGSVSYAGCVDDFKAMIDKNKTSLVKQRVIEVKSQKDFKNLRSAELKAVSNYVNYLEFVFDGSNSLQVTTEQYQTKKDQESVGYRISVTDGGDESNVRYYIKIDPGMQDVAYLILYRAWENQSPEYKFLCERY